MMAPAKRKATTTPNAGGEQSAPASKKRKPEPAKLSLDEQIAAYKQDLSKDYVFDFFRDTPMPSLAAVRSRVNKLFDTGIMTKSEFCRAVGANTNTLNRFLSPQSGPTRGAGSIVYPSAAAWFRQREMAGLKMPDVRKLQKKEADAKAAAAPEAEDDGSPSSPAPASAKKKKGPAAKGDNGLPDISDIYLDGEDEDEVPIYDTCDEVRRKINAHLRKTPGLTEAEFRRTLFAQLRKTKAKGIQGKQLSDFRGAKGSRSGIKSSVYYAAYVYFEKLRLARGQHKTAHRETMEDIHLGGIDRSVHTGMR